MTIIATAGARFRAALKAEKPLQIIGAINAYHAMLATQSGFKAIYLSGGGVAAGSLGLPDLGISTLEDVLIDVRRITDAVETPLLVDIDTGWGGAFNIARSVKSIAKAGAAAVHIEDQVSAKRCGHRPNKAIVSLDEMVDRVKAAVDAKPYDDFIVMARTDALAVEGLQSAIDRACACADAGADMIAVDASLRKRLDGSTGPEFVARARELGIPILGDIDTLEAAVASEKAGADAVSTTISGYTNGVVPKTPDIDLVGECARACKIPVIAEGRYYTPEDVAKAFKAGAWSVCVGGAITDPLLSTKRFIANMH